MSETASPTRPLVEIVTHTPESKWDKPTVTTIVNGRSRYSDGPVATIKIRKLNSYAEPVLVLRGATIEQDRDGFRVGSRHLTATDVEHDAAYVALLHGAGSLTFRDMIGSTMKFTGVLLAAEFYTDDPLVDPAHAEDRHGGFCDDEHCDPVGHPFLKFTPPTQPWVAALYDIEVAFVDAS